MKNKELAQLVLDEWKEGYIVFQTIEGIQKCKIEEFVKQPLEGQMYDINRDTVTILSFIDEPTWLNNWANSKLVEYYYNRCKELEAKLKGKK